MEEESDISVHCVTENKDSLDKILTVYPFADHKQRPALLSEVEDSETGENHR